MGEPAFNLPEDDRPSIRPDLPGLRALEGGSEGDGVPRGILSSVGESGKAPKGGGDDKSVSPNGLAAAEAGIGSIANQLGKGYTGGAGSKVNAVKNLLWKDKKRRNTTIVGGVAGALIALVFTVMGITSGPLQSIELAQMLMKNFGGSEHDSSLRVSSLFRYARSNDVGETRVGKLGSLTFAKTTAQLKDLGIEFQRNPYTGNPKSMTVDTEKLAERYPEMKGMSRAETQSFLESKFSVEPGEFRQISGLGGGKWALSTKGYGIGSTRALVSSTLSNLDNGKIVTALKMRSMAAFFNTPSLWHPLKRAVANKENTVADVVAQKAAEEKRLKALEPKPTEAQAEAEGRLKDAFKSTQGKIGAALLITGAMCLVRSTANDVVTVNRAAIAAPAAVHAADAIAIGAQIQSGQDVDMSAVSGAVASSIDANGDSYFTAKALSATATPDNPQGVDISPDYKQGFSIDTTAANIKDTIGGGTLGDAACNPIGQAIQLVGGVALLAAGPFSDGATWYVVVLAKGAAFVATAGVMSMVEHELTNLFSSGTIIPTVLAGPVGGNLLAYGARELGNIEARSSGGVASSDSNTTTGDAQQQLQDDKEFQSKSALARTFDVHDYRSLISRVIEQQNPNPIQNISTMATSLLSVNKWMATITSVFSPLAHAATNQPYDWGFPQYIIPDSIINNPTYADPYANADEVAAVLDLEVANDATAYIPKAKTCFGVTISKDPSGWNAVASDDVNPNGVDYLAANCGDLSDETWQRVILFIFDTRTMAATACYQGDAKACTDIGTGDAAPDPTTTPPASTATGSPTTCPTGTDAGTGDGYQNGQLVKVTLCTVQGKPLNVQIAAQVTSMLVEGRAVGLQSGSGFRTMAEQQYLYNCYLTKSCNGGNLAAKPGYSNHQMGLAMDFHCNGPTISSGDACFNWLQQNAAKYGLKNLPSEAWHWSVDGT
jgi:hypothetical protein